MATLHGMCLDCEDYRAGLRKVLGVLTRYKSAARELDEAEACLVRLLGKAPAHRVDAFLDLSFHERETRPDLGQDAAAANVDDNRDTERPSIIPEEDEPSMGDVIVIESLAVPAMGEESSVAT